MPSSRASRRSSLFDPADPDWRWDPILRETRQRHRPPFGGGQSLRERHGGASLRGARIGGGLGGPPSWRAPRLQAGTRKGRQLTLLYSPASRHPAMLRYDGNRWAETTHLAISSIPTIILAE